MAATKILFLYFILLVCNTMAVPPPCETFGYDGTKVDADGVRVCEGKCVTHSQPPQHGYIMQVCVAPEQRAPCFIDRVCVCCVLPLRG